MPEGVGDSAEWLDSQKDGISTATKLMPFAGITFLWFIGVVLSVREGDVCVLGYAAFRDSRGGADWRVLRMFVINGLLSIGETA